MSGTELQVLEVIWDWGGEASIDTIARGVRISNDYARLLCKSLSRHGFIKFSNFQARLKKKGQLEAAKRKASLKKPKKLVISSGYKRKKLILDY